MQHTRETQKEGEKKSGMTGSNRRRRWGCYQETSMTVYGIRKKARVVSNADKHGLSR